MARSNFAVFASGRGSNFLAVQEQIAAGNISGDIVCLISNKRTAPALEKAQNLDIPAFHKSPRQFENEKSYTNDHIDTLKEYEIDYILLAGYMKKIPDAVVQAYPHRILNIHPALLPSFGGKGYYGMRVHDAVIERGVKWTGVTVHFVDEVYDHGPIIYQWPVRVRDDDTPESLAERVLEYEHKAYPKVVRWVSEGWITAEGMRTQYTGPSEEWDI
ncbi:MAG: Phosphoribosylglycinamide formyltransferase [Candidatus Marinimicrobia bacterium]|nr:Phosphoribosylglycinamide formyltransferase [Candidatus Neomarinimicrobiota bacterium]